MAKHKTSKSQKTKHIGAKPIPNLGEAAPPFAEYSSPGIHTKYDAFGGYSELQSKDTNAKPEPYKSDLEYDAKVWLAERESDPALKKPGDLLLTLAMICAEQAAGIVSWSRKLAERTASLRASFSERFVILNSVYVLSAVLQKMRDLPDEEWDRSPFTRGSHCFGIQDVSVLPGLDRFCIEALISTLDWIFRWTWSITGRGPDCRPIKEVINDAVAQTGILDFNEWSHQFSFDVFQDADPFPGSGRLCLPKLLPDDYDVEDELQRVVIELMHEHKAAQGKVAENPPETKPAEEEPGTERSLTRMGGEHNRPEPPGSEAGLKAEGLLGQKNEPEKVWGLAAEKQKAEAIIELVDSKIPETSAISGSDDSGDIWKVAWDKADKDYIPSGEARVQFTPRGKLTAPKLSTKIGKIPVHYMRKRGLGCRVHIGEFLAWTKEQFPTDAERAEIADEWLAEVEARKADERAKRRDK